MVLTQNGNEHSFCAPQEQSHAQPTKTYIAVATRVTALAADTFRLCHAFTLLHNCCNQHAPQPWQGPAPMQIAHHYLKDNVNHANM